MNTLSLILLLIYIALAIVEMPFAVATYLDAKENNSINVKLLTFGCILIVLFAPVCFCLQIGMFLYYQLND